MKVEIVVNGGFIVRYGVSKFLIDNNTITLMYNSTTPDVYDDVEINGRIHSVCECENLYYETLSEDLESYSDGDVIDIDVGPKPCSIPDFTSRTMSNHSVDTEDVMDSPAFSD